MRSRIAEILLYGVIVFGGMAVLLRIDAFDLLYEFTRTHESYELDEFLLLLPLLLICSTIFSALRLMELKRQRNALQQSKNKLSKAYDRLDGLSRYREKFLFRACYELKRPIICAAEHIMRMTPPDESHDRAVARDAANSLETLLCLMDDLAASTLDEGHRTGTHLGLNVPEFLESIRLLCQSQADAKGLSLHVTRGDIPNDVMCSVGSLRLILLALIGNAIKHTDIGRVSVHCCLNERDPSAMQLSVSDTGKGLSESSLDRVFDPHESSGDVPQCLSDCLGIGLPLVRQLVEEGGGDITVESAPGNGTVFVLNLPIAA